MKKLVLYFIAAMSFQMANAQFVLNPKVAKGSGVCTNFQITSKSTMTNNGNDSIFMWKILESTSTTGWSFFGMCDPFNCVTDLKIGDSSEFKILKTKSGEFIGDFIPNNIVGSGKAKVKIYLKADPTICDTLEFQLNGWATGIKENTNNREFSVFPNPAKDRLTIKYNSREPINVEIYNVLGSKVKSFVHTGPETDVNTGDLQNGLYFIRFKDGNQTISRPFTKSE